MRPNIIEAQWLTEYVREFYTKVPPGMSWVPSRRDGPRGLWPRVKAAWLVLTGKADALIWPDGGRPRKVKP